MKRIIFITIFLPFLIAACSNSDSSANDPQTHEETTEQRENDDKDNGNDNQQDKVVENSQGTFEMVDLERDLGTFESGPLTIQVSDVSLISGTYTDETVIQNLEKEDVEYVSIGTKISTRNEDILFTRNHLSLTTGAGEEVLSPNEFMSDDLSKDILSETDLIRVFTFFLEGSNVEEIDEVTLHIQSPLNSEGEPVGEDIVVDVTF
ncbi:hypothetical protein GLW03_15725 [Halobacillus halophilus]|uniref:hypothetical protein n=1 Tax=Halobacillus halophilus TaxID=1570 RepID=UPI00136D6167|nr:hypothetical protein [Halobacillus halophilus]MYL31267.1 hypothetical protein [Halobacillus halophilus]